MGATLTFPWTGLLLDKTAFPGLRPEASYAAIWTMSLVSRYSDLGAEVTPTGHLPCDHSAARKDITRTNAPIETFQETVVVWTGHLADDMERTNDGCAADIIPSQLLYFVCVLSQNALDYPMQKWTLRVRSLFSASRHTNCVTRLPSLLLVAISFSLRELSVLRLTRFHWQVTATRL
jgi:hypothetical protein